MSDVEFPLYGVCEKCGTEASRLYLYNGKYICKANECYTEEKERDSGRHIRLNKKLEDYRRLCAGSGG